MFDHRAGALKQARASRMRAMDADAASATFLLDRACAELADRLATVSMPFADALVLGDEDGVLEAVLAAARPGIRIARPAHGSTFLADPVSGSLGLAPATADLAVSLFDLHRIADLPGALIQIRRALKPDGLFLACLMGAGTLGELREALLGAEAEFTDGATPRVLPFADVRDMGGLLQRAGFALPVTDTDEIVVRYSRLSRLVSDLRAMGCTNTLADRSRRPLGRAFMARAEAIYAARHGEGDGKLRASFNMVWLSGWAPSPTQPKPLRPGSATVSLKDVLEG